MAFEVIGTSPSTGEVLVVNTDTGDMAWLQGTDTQIAQVTAEIQAFGEFGSISPVEYISPVTEALALAYPELAPPPAEVAPPPPEVAPPPPAEWAPPPTILELIVGTISTTTRNVVQTVIPDLTGLLAELKATILGFLSSILSPIVSAIGWIQEKLVAVWSWAKDTYAMVSDWASHAWTTVSSAVSSAIIQVWYWLQAGFSSLTDWVTTRTSVLWQDISTALSSLWQNLTSWGNQLSSTISSLFSNLWSSISSSLSDLSATVAGLFNNLGQQLVGYFNSLYTWMQEHIIQPMATWWDTFITRILDFPAWVGKLFDAVGSWLSVDIPGSSPRWLAIIKNILDSIVKWFVQDPEYWKERLTPKSMFGFMQLFGLVGTWFTNIIETFNDAMLKIAAQVKGVSPDTALTAYGNFAGVAMSAAAGLIGMTIAGELLHPLKRLGLGNMAAMLFDVTNYKLITGAFVGAMSVALLRTPLTYYFNNAFRSQLPTPRDQIEMYNRGLMGQKEYSQLLGYQGIADYWHEKMFALTETPVGYFALNAISRSGVYLEDLFYRDLKRKGYADEMVPVLIDMFRKTATETVKPIMIGAATRRFKEGFTTEEGFISELQMLRANPSEIPFYLIAAKMDYASDYAGDLVSAYRSAVRTSKMDLEEFRDALLAIPITSQRVEAYVLQERARLKPLEKLKPLAPPKPYYETDPGKVVVDTIRRQRQKKLLTRDEEIVKLRDTGMDGEYAIAIAANDDMRLLEAKEVETVELPPLYETEPGKVEIDTIRRERRKLLIDHKTEVNRLLKLEMPDFFAEALANNDDVRLAEKAGLE